MEFPSSLLFLIVMKLKSKTIHFVLFLFCSSAYGWSPESINRWNKASETYSASMTGPAFSTFWGGFRRAVHFSRNQGSMVNLKLEGFKKEVPVYLQLNKQKRDLILFYPGVFGKPDGRISPQVIDELEKRNVHVVVIPNLLAPTYLSARPASQGDPLLSEHLNQKKILLEVFKRIDFRYVNKVHVIAESLGCFQALTALNPLPANLPSIETLTLLWPPLYLNRAVKRFDVLIHKSLPHLANCSIWWKWPKVIYSTKGQSLPIGIDDEEKRCLGSWVIGSGFVGSIKDTATEVANISEATVPLNFSDFVNSVTPEMVSTMAKEDERLSIEFLLKPFKFSQTKIRIASSIDDFLNVPDEWEKLKKSRPDLASHIYLFSWGGHSGPIGLDDFIETVANDVLSRR